MTVKPEIKQVLGAATNQLETSLEILNGSQLTESQRFHLMQVEQVLCSEGALPEPDEP